MTYAPELIVFIAVPGVGVLILAALIYVTSRTDRQFRSALRLSQDAKNG